MFEPIPGIWRCDGLQGLPDRSPEALARTRLGLPQCCLQRARVALPGRYIRRGVRREAQRPACDSPCGHGGYVGARTRRPAATFVSQQVHTLQHPAHGGHTDPQHMLLLELGTKHLRSGIVLGLGYLRRGHGQCATSPMVHPRIATSPGTRGLHRTGSASTSCEPK
jgi:hypothetical protein